MTTRGPGDGAPARPAIRRATPLGIAPPSSKAGIRAAAGPVSPTHLAGPSTPDDTIDPLDSAATLPRQPLDDQAAEAALRGLRPDATQEVAVENILLEAYAAAPAVPPSPISSASQALSASRRAPPMEPRRTSSARLAIPRPAPLPSTRAMAAAAPERAEIAAAIAACVPAQGAPPAPPSELALGRSAASPGRYAEYTSQQLPPVVSIPARTVPESSTDLASVAGPSPSLGPRPLPSVEPFGALSSPLPPPGPASSAPPPAAQPPASVRPPGPEFSPPEFPPYARPSALPLFVAEPPSKSKGSSGPLFAALGFVAVCVGLGAFVVGGRFAAAHRDEDEGTRAAPTSEPNSIAPATSAAPAPGPSAVITAPPQASSAVAAVVANASPPPAAVQDASPEPAASLAATSSPVASAASAPSPAAPEPAIPADMTLVTFPRSAKGHRVYVDHALFRDDAARPAMLKCGAHVIKIGSAGKPRPTDLPCGQAFALPAH